MPLEIKIMSIYAQFIIECRRSSHVPLIRRMRRLYILCLYTEEALGERLARHPESHMIAEHQFGRIRVQIGLVSYPSVGVAFKVVLQER